MTLWWLLVPTTYFSGSFPAAGFVGRIIGRDPSNEGSGNPGATNVYRVAGYRAGTAVLLIDIAKGVIPVVVALLFANRNVATICSAAAVIGHIFPVFSHFKGGKGVATYGGITIALNPIVGIGALIFWITVAAITRISSLAGLFTLPAIAITLGLIGRPAIEIWTAVGLSLLIAYRHKENIIRLIMGEEGSRKNN